MQQNKIPINRPSITDLEMTYVNDAMANGWGEKCYQYIHRFEKEFAEYHDTKFAMATSSCTGAIHLALMAMGVKAGDEVIVPEITWIASVSPVLYVGAKPVFVDVLKDTWCIDPEKIKEAITPKTKVIIAAHIYGNVCEMDTINAIAGEHGLMVLVDAAEGLGSEYKGRKTGSNGDVGVFSFHGTKTMTTGEGGMMITSNADIFEKANILNNHGRNANDPEHKMFWMRDYGYKYKMSNIQAALGCAQLSRLDDLVEKKRRIFGWYSELLKDIPCRMNAEMANTKNGYWLPTVVFDDSVDFDGESFFKLMKDNDIDCRPFFFPLSSLPMFEDKKENKVAYGIYEKGINLPSFHDMEQSQAVRIISLLRKYLQNNFIKIALLEQLIPVL